ncbi:alpha/beta fold hydrolase [Actinomycetospora soli]|uniref:alpha/beta fold hydrolase n=1 Tax=Actinomycetospora soli TaxID=2893887 RepID=UPI001E5AE90B|nr:alpha/beta hydrolase [Actinomycetospora soli]MCD2189965.1 alpha/beta hydrolase [Actinomycetospora soli]
MPTFTTADDVALTYSDRGGRGVPLVMLHGWGQTRAMFHHQLDGLDRRVITLDQRGHGESAKPHHGYRIARLAQDLHEFLDHLGVEEVDLLGWSMGVSVCWSYLDQRGSARVRRLVAVDQPAAVAAVPWMSRTEQQQCGAIFDVAGLVALGGELAGEKGEAALEDFVRSMFSGEPKPDVWEFVRQEIRSTPAYAGVPLLFDHCAQDWRDVLPRVDVPTLVLGCDGSHVAPSSQEYIADQIPDARLHVFSADEARSHFPFLENPERFNAVVEEFLGATS